MYTLEDVAPVLAAFAVVGAAARFIYACGTWIDAEGSRGG
jgi:hypothetical protein